MQPLNVVTLAVGHAALGTDHSRRRFEFNYCTIKVIWLMLIVLSGSFHVVKWLLGLM